MLMFILKVVLNEILSDFAFYFYIFIMLFVMKHNILRNSRRKSIINGRKINHQQKNMFIMCKKMHGPVLKSLKPKRFGPKSEKILTGTEPEIELC